MDVSVSSESTWERDSVEGYIHFINRRFVSSESVTSRIATQFIPLHKHDVMDW